MDGLVKLGFVARLAEDLGGVGRYEKSAEENDRLEENDYQRWICESKKPIFEARLAVLRCLRTIFLPLESILRSSTDNLEYNEMEDKPEKNLEGTSLMNLEKSIYIRVISKIPLHAPEKVFYENIGKGEVFNQIWQILNSTEEKVLKEKNKLTSLLNTLFDIKDFKFQFAKSTESSKVIGSSEQQHESSNSQKIVSSYNQETVNVETLLTPAKHLSPSSHTYAESFSSRKYLDDNYYQVYKSELEEYYNEENKRFKEIDILSEYVLYRLLSCEHLDQTELSKRHSDARSMFSLKESYRKRHSFSSMEIISNVQPIVDTSMIYDLQYFTRFNSKHMSHNFALYIKGVIDNLDGKQQTTSLSSSPIISRQTSRAHSRTFKLEPIQSEDSMDIIEEVKKFKDII